MDSSRSIFHRATGPGLALAAAIALAACAAPPHRPPFAQPPMVVQPPPAEPVAPAQPAAPAAAQLNDPQVVGIVLTADQIEVRLGQMALQKSRDPRIRGFANRMVRDHTQLINALAATARRARLQPQQSAVTNNLAGSAQQVMSQLAQYNGRAFDRAYLHNEVAFHAQVINATERQLLPQTRSPLLRQALRNARPVLVSHLQHARQLEAAFGGR